MVLICFACLWWGLFVAQNGGYHCRGSFDAVNKRAIVCDFHADRVDRSVWQQ